MRVLVTGANGLLGHHIVNELLDRDYQVSVIVRSTGNLFIDTSRITVFKGNFYDKGLLKDVLTGIDAIIHVAAVTATNLLHYKDYYEINVEATQLMIDLARENGIKKLVYVSTTNTIGNGSKEKPSDEGAAFAFPFTRSFYAKSKFEAEMLIRKYSEEPEVHAVIINTAFMIGKYDTKPGSGRIMLMGYGRKRVLTTTGGKNFVSARSVAVACVNAITMGITGENYLATGHNMSFGEFYQLQAEITACRQKMWVIPSAFMRVIGLIGNVLKGVGVKTDISLNNINQLLINEYYDGSKAREQLAMPETNLSDDIREALDWFIEHGYLKKKRL
jgi:nucleoside-diphosphate-sugar epimerase